MNSIELKASISKFLKAMLIVDVVWAAVLATLQSIFLAQAGIVIGANGIATSVAVGSSWLMTFIIGLFQGGVLLFFITLLFGLWVFVYHMMTKTLDKNAKVAIAQIFLGVAMVDLVWGLIQGIYAAAVVAGIGTAPAISASGAVVAAASILSFIVSFGIGIFTAAVALTLLGVFAFVILALFAFFKKG